MVSEPSTISVAKARGTIIGTPVPASFAVSNIADFDDYVKIVLAAFPEIVPKLIMGLDENNRLVFPKFDSITRELRVRTQFNEDNEDVVEETVAGATTAVITYTNTTLLYGAMARSAGAGGAGSVTVMDSSSNDNLFLAVISATATCQFPYNKLQDATDYGCRTPPILIPAGWKLELYHENNVKYSYQALVVK